MSQPRSDVKRKKPPVPTVEPSADWDLNAYAQRYHGHTLVARLQFMAPRLEKQRTEALSMAVEALKKSRNTSLYRQLYEEAGELGVTLPPIDSAWFEAEDKKANMEQDELSGQLNVHKQNLIRQKIWV